MYAVRLWSVRHARGMNAFYGGFEALLVRLHRVFRAVGYERAEQPVAAVEKAVKGFLFDCRMCGQCILSSTGMSCPMNCPKNLRNGPCGGVRADGNCEVKENMRCVWVEAYRGSERIPEGVEAMSKVQFAVDQRCQGRSSWLRVAREKNDSSSSTSGTPGRPPASPDSSSSTAARSSGTSQNRSSSTSARAPGTPQSPV